MCRLRTPWRETWWPDQPSTGLYNGNGPDGFSARNPMRVSSDDVDDFIFGYGPERPYSQSDAKP